MTNVLGYNLNIALITINPSLDASTISMFQFDFTVGTVKVPAGYDVPSATIYSRIKFIFETKLGYD